MMASISTYFSVYIYIYIYIIVDVLCKTYKSWPDKTDYKYRFYKRKYIKITMDLVNKYEKMLHFFSESANFPKTKSARKPTT
jgi:hypothetical protein